MTRIPDTIEHASAPEHIRALAEQWYETRGKGLPVVDLAELHAWIRHCYTTMAAKARELGVILWEGRALCCVERALGWNTYADEDADKHDGSRSMLCVMLVCDARRSVVETV